MLGVSGDHPGIVRHTKRRLHLLMTYGPGEFSGGASQKGKGLGRNDESVIYL
jgi:hypothetical protein